MNPLPNSPNQRNEKTPETQKPLDKYLQFAKEKLTPKEFELFMYLRKKIQMEEKLGPKARADYIKIRDKVEAHKALKKTKLKIAEQLRKAREEILEEPKEYMRSTQRFLEREIIGISILSMIDNYNPTNTAKLRGELAKAFLLSLGKQGLRLDKHKLPTKKQVQNTKRILTKVEKEIIDLTNDL